MDAVSGTTRPTRGRSSLTSWVLGPELYWIALYVAAALPVALNQPPADAGNTVLEWLIYMVPLLGIPASLVLFYRRAAAHRHWLGARMKLATFFGLNAVLFRLIDGIDYGDSRNAGVLAFWITSLMLGGLVFLVGAVARRTIARRRRAA